MAFNREKGLEDLVKENIRLSRENNRLMRKIWRAEVFGFWGKVIFFAFIVGVPVFVYRYYVADYLEQIQSAYQEMREDFSSVSDLPNKLQVGNVIDGIQDRIKEEIE